MAFEPKNEAFAGKIRQVTIGTGEQAITLGGQSVLPFYTFDGEIPNAPKIGIEVSDNLAGWDVPGLATLYDGCTTMAQRAVKAAQVEGVEFLCLRFAAADPNGEDRPVEACVADAKAVAEAVKLPLTVMGCGNLVKDGVLLPAIAQALEGRNILVMSVKNEDYHTLGPTVAKMGHKLCAETADDINLAKQLNIMLRGAGVPQDSLVMNIGTAAVGYGYDYVASIFDRIRDGALKQCDEDLQMPIIAPVSTETWAVKESTATQQDEPAWGDREERGISMEIATAAANLTGGADAVILRHPGAIAAIRQFIAQLM